MKKGLLKRLKTETQPVPESEKFIDLGDINIEGLELESSAGGMELRVAEVNTFDDRIWIYYIISNFIHVSPA